MGVTGRVKGKGAVGGTDRGEGEGTTVRAPRHGGAGVGGGAEGDGVADAEAVGIVGI